MLTLIVNKVVRTLLLFWNLQHLWWLKYIYSVPFVPLHLYVKNKLNIFGLPFQNRTSILKSSFDFKMELRFRNGASISKWSFDFKMELRFRNRASILKWSFDFEMELPFRNGASISKWSFDFEMELRFRNRASISKWSFDFKIELRFQLKIFHVTFWTEKRHVISVTCSCTCLFSGFYRGQKLADQRWEEKR